jgi:hypothetical protein
MRSLMPTRSVLTQTRQLPDLLMLMADAVFGRGAACVSQPSKTVAQSTAMDANIPITAAIFSAFLKCPTKAHLMAIGEPAPGAYFADLETRISSMYKAAAKRRSPTGVEVVELLDFRELWGSLDHDAIMHYVDCDTAVYDIAPPPHRPGWRQRQELSPSGTFVPIRFLPWDKPGLSDNLLVCFCALALSQTTGTLADTGTVIYGEEHRRKTVKIADHTVRTRQTIDAIGVTCHGREPPPLVPEHTLRRLRFPTKLSRSRRRTRRFEPAQRDDRQGAGKM